MPTPSTPTERAWGFAPKLSLACGVLGPLLFVAAFLIEGATRPNYSARRHFISSLSLGERGWRQIANFLLSGTLLLGFAIGLRRRFHAGNGSRWGPNLLGLYGLSYLGAGLFATDPVLGYPPGAPRRRTARGTLHNLASLVAFTSLPAACFVLARRFAHNPAWRGWSHYSISTAMLMSVFVILASLAARFAPNESPGLFQRLSVITGNGWIVLLALRLLRDRMPPKAEPRTIPAA